MSAAVTLQQEHFGRGYRWLPLSGQTRLVLPRYFSSHLKSTGHSCQSRRGNGEGKRTTWRVSQTPASIADSNQMETVSNSEGIATAACKRTGEGAREARGKRLSERWIALKSRGGDNDKGVGKGCVSRSALEKSGSTGC